MLKSLITYLKVITIFWFVFSAWGLYAKNFDPTDFIKSEFTKIALPNNASLPPDAQIAFEFPFMLFALLSMVSSVLMFYIIHFALSKKEQWAADALLIAASVWVIGAIAIILTYSYYFYFWSVGIFSITILFPLVLVRKYLR